MPRGPGSFGPGLSLEQAFSWTCVCRSKSAASRGGLMSNEMVMDDIRQFKEKTGATRLSMIWCGSTEVYHQAAAVHASLKDFECGLQKSDPEISPSQIYAYAALKMGIPYANGAPHMTTD